MNLPIKCSCSNVQGYLEGVSLESGNHLKCMCDDCQRFARHLGNESQILDDNGGTEIFQIPPSHIKFTQGQENLSCLRLTPKGILRWYTSCCNTPIANTISYKMAFAGVIINCLDFSNLNKDEVLGPIKYYCMAKYCIGDAPEGVDAGFSKILTLKIIVSLLLGYVLKRYSPNPFFNEETGQPISKPFVVDAS